MKIGRIYGSDGSKNYFFVNKEGVHSFVPETEFKKGFNPFHEEDLAKLKDLIEVRSYTFESCPQGSKLATPIKVTGVTCIGMNYKEHAEECGADWTTFIAPTIFGRSLTSVNDPFGDVLIPGPYTFRGKPLGDGVVRFDYEAELAVVIGKPCYNVTVEEALDYVAGYMVAGDYSERTRQLQNGSQQWHAGKCLPTSFTVGPYLVTKDEITNPQNLRLKLWVNDEIRQDDSTEGMIFSIAECISALSQTDLLPAGFVISTGTPKGVVTKGKPEQIIFDWLKEGDVVKTTIRGDNVDLGTQIQTCFNSTQERIDLLKL
jgi:2-keto-4-pentenoate hydratase/2-oxohepta-3-ene-1,7-dioic acid hydratase in catechol pathway